MKQQFNRFLTRGLLFSLASSIFISGIFVSGIFMPAEAQVGPQPPRQAPQKESVIGNSLKKLFKKGEEPSTESPDDVGPKKNLPAQQQQEDPEGKAASSEEHEKAPARTPMIEQTPLQNAQIDKPTVSEENPPLALPKLDDVANPLGFGSVLEKLDQAEKLLKLKNYTQAKSLLTPLREWTISATEAHINLYKVLSNIPSARAQGELEKQAALQFALLRDKTMFLLGKVAIAEGEPKAAVKQLVEVIKSQPRSDMGVQGYEMLQQIGFTQKVQLAE